MSETLPEPVPADAVQGQGDPAADHNQAVTALNQVISYLNTIGPSGAPDATSAGKGLVRLAGDLTGTADFPRVAGLDTKITDTDSRLTNARTPVAHASSHGDGGTDEIVVSIDQVTDLANQLAASASANTRVWDPAAGTWSARPALPAGHPALAFSTTDPDATAPPAALVGDLWFRHPAAAAV